MTPAERNHKVARLSVLAAMAERSPADANITWDSAVGIVGEAMARRVDHLASTSERIDRLIQIVDAREGGHA